MHLWTLELAVVIRVVDPIEMAAIAPPVEANTTPHLIVLKVQEIAAWDTSVWDNGAARGWLLHRELMVLTLEGGGGNSMGNCCR